MTATAGRAAQAARPVESVRTGAAAGPKHLLTFDVEEYFQVEAAARRLRPADWDSYPRRLAPCVDRILAMLNEHKAGATFFILGWVARQEPGVVRAIAAAGHEIASHGMSHGMLARLTPAQFRDELLESRRLLEDLSGRPVIGYRAPTFSVTAGTAWAIDVLAECGYQYDSSVFPICHDRYGVPGAPRWPHWAVGPGGGRILEFPPLTARLLGANLPVGGGGDLRLLPIRLIGLALRSAARRNQPAMLYVHPWELDPRQPVLPMPFLSRRRHRLNLHRTERKLQWLLERFPFAEVRARLDDIRSADLQTFQYATPS